MRFQHSKDDGFGSGWRFQWGWLTGRLDPVRGSLAHSDHVVEAAAKRLTSFITRHPFTFLSIWIALALVGVIGNGPEIY